MSWNSFVSWVDNDFNHVRPHGMLLFMGLLALPLLLAFALDAPTEVIEIARAAALIGVMFLLMPYYIYRQIRNFNRRAAELRQDKNG